MGLRYRKATLLKKICKFWVELDKMDDKTSSLNMKEWFVGLISLEDS